MLERAQELNFDQIDLQHFGAAAEIQQADTGAGIVRLAQIALQLPTSGAAN